MSNINLILHLLLAVFTVAQIIFILNKNSNYQIQMQRILYNTFLDQSDKTDFDWPKKKFIFTPEELVNQIKQSIKNYHKLETQFAFDYISIKKSRSFKDKEETQSNQPNTEGDQAGEIISYLTVNYIPFANKQTNYFTLRDNNLGPFDLQNNELFDFLNSVSSMKNQFKFNSYDNDSSNFKIYWIVTQHFDFTLRGHITLTLNIDYAYLDEQTLSASEDHWIYLAVLCLATFSVLVETSNTNSNPNPTSWTILVLIGNALQIVGAMTALYNVAKFSNYNNIIIASGTFFSLLTVGMYIAQSHKWNLIYTTISSGYKMVFIITMSAVPVYLGLMLLAKAIFWNSYFFSDLGLTSMALYSLMQMDSTLNIFKVLVGVNPVLGTFYMFFFWLVLFVVSRRIFIVLIEDIYVLRQIRSGNSFMNDIIPFKSSIINDAEKRYVYGEINRNEENDNKNNQDIQHNQEQERELVNANLINPEELDQLEYTQKTKVSKEIYFKIEGKRLVRLSQEGDCRRSDTETYINELNKQLDQLNE